ncbi:MAG: hypothetical protein M3342_22860 [Bacteroidota bacterium]|nr:hypothetical protein [Bacteroidota bacterium]
MASPATKSPQLISPQTLRKAIGWLGVLLPAAMIIGNSLFRQCDLLQSSISHYYYTVTGHWLVGILCAVAMFLVSYKGYTREDNIATSIAGFSAVLIAFFPTNIENNVPVEIAMNRCVLFTLPENNIRNVIHYASAGLFFLTLAYISYFLFTKTDKEKTKEKIIRNRIFKTCAIIIVVSILLIALYGIFEEKLNGLKKYKPVFWLEWIALMAFGLSWLVKGEIVLKDYSLERKKNKAG